MDQIWTTEAAVLAGKGVICRCRSLDDDRGGCGVAPVCVAVRAANTFRAAEVVKILEEAIQQRGAFLDPVTLPLDELRAAGRLVAQAGR